MVTETLDSAMATDTLSVRKFFEGKVIFLTGATGFLGKSLIEKLLDTCKVRKIMILIREKKGKSVEERCREFRNDQLFKFRTDPKKLEIVVPVAGDMGAPGLGLSASDRNKVISEADIIIHSAATVKFDEPLDVAMKMNVLGTLAVLNLCKDTKNLQLFVCVGTAFSRCYTGRFEEEIPPPIADPYELITLMKEQDAETFNGPTFEKIRNGHPNTYTLTKNVSEGMVNDFCATHAIRTVIAKPGIIIAPIKEPRPFYVDGISQGTPSVGASLGVAVTRVVPGHKDNHFPAIPVDICANAILVVSADAVDKFDKSPADKKVILYGLYNTSSNFPRTEHTFHTVCRSAQKYPTLRAVRPPVTVSFSRHPVSYKVKAWILDFVFAFFFDLTLTMAGKPAKMTRIVSKSQKLMGVLGYFVSKDWQLTGKNLDMALTRLSSEEKTLFDCDMSRIDWTDYFENFWLGIRKWVFREELDNLHIARARVNRLKLTYYSACTLLSMITGLLLLSLLQSFALLFSSFSMTNRLAPNIL